jgi:hypothetical protein
MSLLFALDGCLFEMGEIGLKLMENEIDFLEVH